MARALALVLLLFVIEPSVVAQPEEPSSLQTAISPVEPHLEFTLVDPDARVRAWQEVRLVVTIYSGGSPNGIGIDSLALSIPKSLGLRVAGSPRDSENVIETPSELRTPGARIELPPVELEGKPLRELGFSRVLGLLTYRAGKESIVAVLRYKKLDDPVQQIQTKRLDLNVSGHPFGMYAGAIVGAFLVGLFLAITSRPPNVARSFLLRFVRGSVATAIAVLVLQTTSDVHFPVTVTVEDFYGGVLLGLFGDQVAQTIQQRIGQRWRRGRKN